MAPMLLVALTAVGLAPLRPSITSPAVVPAIARARLSLPAMAAADNGPAALGGFVKDRAAGLALAGGIGFVAEATASSVAVSLSPLLYATAFGIALGNVVRLWDPEMKSLAPTAVGMQFAKKRMLRAGIILYGAKVTFGKLLGIGLPGLLTDLYAVVSTLLLGFALGRALGLTESLTTLIATGSAICGCSAVAATQPSAPRRRLNPCRALLSLALLVAVDELLPLLSASSQSSTPRRTRSRPPLASSCSAARAACSCTLTSTVPCRRWRPIPS